MTVTSRTPVRRLSAAQRDAFWAEGARPITDTTSLGAFYFPADERLRDLLETYEGHR